MTRVLLAIDGSAAATAAARRAVDVLGTDQDYVGLAVVRLALMTPSAPTPLVTGFPGAGFTEPEEPEPEQVAASAGRAESEARDDLERALGGLRISARRRVEAGEIGETICRVATAERADVIVLGAHGAGRARRLLLGSVSEHVLEHASCLVLILPTNAITGRA